MSKMISLVGAVTRELGKSLVLAWISQYIENDYSELKDTAYYYFPEEFGNTFKVIGLSENSKIEVIIKLRSNTED